MPKSQSPVSWGCHAGEKKANKPINYALVICASFFIVVCVFMSVYGCMWVCVGVHVEDAFFFFFEIDSFIGLGFAK